VFRLRMSVFKDYKEAREKKGDRKSSSPTTEHLGGEKKTRSQGGAIKKRSPFISRVPSYSEEINKTT